MGASWCPSVVPPHHLPATPVSKYGLNLPPYLLTYVSYFSCDFVSSSVLFFLFFVFGVKKLWQLTRPACWCGFGGVFVSFRWRSWSMQNNTAGRRKTLKNENIKISRQICSRWMGACMNDEWMWVCSGDSSTAKHLSAAAVLGKIGVPAWVFLYNFCCYYY